jgi:hypothetical protein
MAMVMAMKAMIEFAWSWSSLPLALAVGNGHRTQGGHHALGQRYRTPAAVAGRTASTYRRIPANPWRPVLQEICLVVIARICPQPRPSSSMLSTRRGARACSQPPATSHQHQRHACQHTYLLYHNTASLFFPTWALFSSLGRTAPGGSD